MKTKHTEIGKIDQANEKKVCSEATVLSLAHKSVRCSTESQNKHFAIIQEYSGSQSRNSVVG